jgi:hypothetical protein
MERRREPVLIMEHSESQKGSNAGNCLLRGWSNHVMHRNSVMLNERPAPGNT